MNNSDKVYPQVNDVPDNIKKEWLNNAPESLSQNDIIQLKDCIAFVLDKDEDLDKEGVNELWQLNMKLVSLMEGN